MLFPCFIVAWSIHQLDWLQKLKVKLITNENSNQIIQQYAYIGQTDNNYSCINKLLLWRNKIVILQNSSKINLILK